MLDDDARLRLLGELDMTVGDDVLDAVAAVAAQVCGTPMAAVTLVGLEEQRFVGSFGLRVTGTDRGSSFCAVAMEDPRGTLLVPDTHQDIRFAGNALVLGRPHIRSYAGVPLLAREEIPLGAVCVLSDRPHALDTDQVDSLRRLGLVAERLLQARRTGRELQATMADLAAAQIAEEASREQFRAAFDHATVGMTLVDHNCVYIRVNAAFADLLGYTVEELNGRPFRDFTAPSHHDGDLAAIADLVGGRRRTSLRDKNYIHRDGRVVPALVSSSLIRPRPDEPWLLLNSVESLVERRAAETRLTELHSAVDGIISIDENNRVIAWNLGAERMLGYAAADMIGGPLDRIILPARRSNHPELLAQVAAAGPGQEEKNKLEVPIVHADGRELLAELTLSRWMDDDKPRHTAILRDITAQRRAETCTGLVRHAAVIANRTNDVTEATTTIIAEVCSRLGWPAGNGWSASKEPPVWYVPEHVHAPGEGCRLRELAEQGSVPSPRNVHLATETHVYPPDETAGVLGATVHRCGIGGAVAAPVMTGGEVIGILGFLLPAGAATPDAEVLDALQQVGLALGRVIERHLADEVLNRQANQDPVTDLANRRLLLDRIADCQHAPGGRSAVLLINLDRFRLINDSFGYVVGDEALREVAGRLRAGVREGDLVARLSADEFVVLARRDGSAEAPFTDLAEELLAVLHEPVHLVGHRLHVRASIGICPITADPDAFGNPASILRDADAALHQAKRRGKDQVQVFDTALRSTAEQRMNDENALAEAIAGGRLVVYYQPIIDLNSGLPAGAEALVRWPRPGHGIVAPDEFIPLAEESGLIVDLGRWVLRQACLDAASWPQTVPAMAEATVSVNVSTRQLTHPRFLTDLDGALAESDLPAPRLIVEITETALIEDTDIVMETLHAIRARGVHLALDDFGTGYSSLSYVQTLPATILKIDKSFVDPITAPGEGTALSEVVLKLAEATGLRTVAEGVETPGQAAALQALGCHRGQGFHWSKPVPQERLQEAVTELVPIADPIAGAVRPV